MSADSAAIGLLHTAGELNLPRYYELTESAAPASDLAKRSLQLLGLLAASLSLFTLGVWLGRRNA